MKLTWLELLTRRLQPPRRQGRRREDKGGLCICWLSEKSTTTSKHLTENSDLMESARPSQCEHSCWWPYTQCAHMTGSHGQMFGSCFNLTLKTLMRSSTSDSEGHGVNSDKAVTGHPACSASSSAILGPLLITTLNFFSRLDKPIINKTIIRHRHVLLKRVPLVKWGEWRRLLHSC